MAALTIQLSKLQPKLDDLYIKVREREREGKLQNESCRHCHLAAVLGTAH
jgi:hypothetical protein